MFFVVVGGSGFHVNLNDCFFEKQKPFEVHGGCVNNFPPSILNMEYAVPQSEFASHKS